ncbi:DEAD/DEAH box helicase [Flavobacteriaceae bacterium AU392]|nr:DEAD/DEAH box helicase [Flavobacteriaceae bacterium]RKM85838.1 DEAD/DEAH box helicase [Flavobacteriaceae bacterium AU392]
MSFKKLIEPLKEAIHRNNFEAPLPFQKQILPKIKGGASVFAIAPDGSGKTTTLILSVIQKLKGKAFEDAPRALIFVKDKKAALELKQHFEIYTKGTDLRVYALYEEHNIDSQREEIYVGTDIVIATPKRLNKIFYLNGIHLGQLQLFIVEDAEFLFTTNTQGEVSRTPESINKCQYVVFSSTFDARFKRWQDTFMYNARVIEFKE